MDVGKTLQRGEFRVMRTQISPKPSEPAHLWALVWRDRVRDAVRCPWHAT